MSPLVLSWDEEVTLFLEHFLRANNSAEDMLICAAFLTERLPVITATFEKYISAETLKKFVNSSTGCSISKADAIGRKVAYNKKFEKEVLKATNTFLSDENLNDIKAYLTSFISRAVRDKYYLTSFEISDLYFGD